MSKCNQCGQCCMANGLIPPLIPGEEVPEWLSCLVNRLRTEFGDTAEEYPCVFLTDDLRCAIHEMARPEICVNFLCDGEASAVPGNEHPDDCDCERCDDRRGQVPYYTSASG